MLFLVVPRLDVHIEFDIARPFFVRVRLGAQMKLRARKIVEVKSVEVNLPIPGSDEGVHRMKKDSKKR